MLQREEVLGKFPQVIARDLRCLDGELYLTLDPAVQPTKVALQWLPVAIREQLQGEIESVEHMDVIERVSQPTDN